MLSDSDLGIKKLMRRPIKALAVPAAAYGKGAPQRSYRERNSHPAAWDGCRRNGIFGRDADRDAEPAWRRDYFQTQIGDGWIADHALSRRVNRDGDPAGGAAWAGCARICLRRGVCG